MDEPKINMLRLESEGNPSITFAPTADRMYYYVSIKTRLTSKEAYAEENRYMDERMIKQIAVINKL